jgi:hypothetical protein
MVHLQILTDLVGMLLSHSDLVRLWLLVPNTGWVCFEESEREGELWLEGAGK